MPVKAYLFISSILNILSVPRPLSIKCNLYIYIYTIPLLKLYLKLNKKLDQLSYIRDIYNVKWWVPIFVVWGTIIFLGYVYLWILYYSQYIYIYGDKYSLNSLFRGLILAMNWRKLAYHEQYWIYSLMLCYIVFFWSHTYRLNGLSNSSTY